MIPLYILNANFAIKALAGLLPVNSINGLEIIGVLLLLAGLLYGIAEARKGRREALKEYTEKQGG